MFRKCVFLVSLFVSSLTLLILATDLRADSVRSYICDETDAKLIVKIDRKNTRMFVGNKWHLAEFEGDLVSVKLQFGGWKFNRKESEFTGWGGDSGYQWPCRRINRYVK